MEFLTALAAILALILSVYLILWKTSRNGKSRGGAPEAPGAWPIIGHLHLLLSSKRRLEFLGEMADKVGPIFRLKLGSNEAIVISSWEMAKECFSASNDVTFSNRQKFMAAELLGYNYAMLAFAPYGPYWRELHKITTLELLSNRRVELLGHIRQSEVKASIREIYDLWDQNKRASGSDKVLVEMKKAFGELTTNIIVRMIVGKRFSGEEEEGGLRFRKAVRDLMKLVVVYTVSDVFPCLRWLDLGGHQKAMKRTGKEMDNMLESWLNEHKQKRVSGKVINKGEQDFMDVMLSFLLDDHGNQTTKNSIGYDVDTITKSTCLGVLTGSQAIASTLFWILSFLMNHPHALKKAQEELDIQVGKERQVEVSDTKNLVYLQAVIKETLRLRPVGNALTARESMEDCVVGGYHVPKGTALLVNSCRIHRDPRVWSNPDEFRPERFLTTHKDVDFRGQQYEFLPFGSGRRSCPGISLALQVMLLTIGSLLHAFQLETPSNECVDINRILGFNPQVTPLDVFVTPRLSSSLY